MSFEEVVLLIEQFRSGDEVLMSEADQLLQNMRQNDIVLFIQSLASVVIHFDSVSNSVLFGAITLLIRPYIIVRSIQLRNDPSLAYMVPSDHINEELAEVLFSLLSHDEDCIRHISSEVLALVSLVLLGIDSNHSVLNSLIHESTNSSNEKRNYSSSSSLKAIFSEFDFDVNQTLYILTHLTQALGSNLCINSKKGIISCVSSFIPSIVRIYEEDTDTIILLINEVIELTKNSSLKYECYSFWNSMISIWYTWVVHCPVLFNLAVNDLETCTDDSMTLLIINFIDDVAKEEYNHVTDDYPSLIKNIIPHVIPLLLRNMCVIKTDICDDESSWEPNNAAFSCLNQIVTLIPQDSIPYLIEFSLPRLNQSSNEEREAALGCMYIILNNSSDIDKEELIIESLNAATTAIQTEIPRLISKGLNLLWALATNFPSLSGYNTIIESLFCLIKSDETTIAKNTSDLIISIVKTDEFEDFEGLFGALLLGSSPVELETAVQILEIHHPEVFVLQYFPRFIAMIDIFSETNSENQLIWAISLVRLGVDYLGNQSHPYLMHLFNSLCEIYEQHRIPEALLALSSICFCSRSRNSPFPQTVLRLIINQVNNFENPILNKIAISSITLYLSKCGINAFLHQLSDSLFLVLSSVEAPLVSKSEAFEAINSLFVSFPHDMAGYYDRFYPLVQSAIEMLFNMPYEDDVEKLGLCSSLSESIVIFFLLSDEFIELLQLSAKAISFAAESPVMNEKCVTEILTLIKKLISIDMEFVQNMFKDNEPLIYLIQEASESSSEIIASEGQEILKAIGNKE